MRLVFVTLEYKAGVFSGNGVCSQSIVRALCKAGHAVLVISAAPHPSWGAAPLPPTSSRLQQEAGLVEVAVPVWGRLDWQCGWREFGEGVGEEAVEAVVGFQADWLLVVDWHAMEAYKRLVGDEQRWRQRGVAIPSMAYLNLRVYTLSEYQGENGEEERRFYRSREKEAVELASAAAALSTRDAEFLWSSLGASGLKAEAVRPQVLLPPLREDIRIIAMREEQRGAAWLMERLPLDDVTELPSSSASAVWGEGRSYLCCCVRLSPEKNADLFASIVEHLAPFLLSSNIVPLLCTGAGGGGQYAESIIKRVQAAASNAQVLRGFMGPTEMAGIFSKTLLNVHPCLYDAYGMTAVEAAAFGVPSVIHEGPGGAVGAAELLDTAKGLSLPLDLSSSTSAIAEGVKLFLSNPSQLAVVGIKAAQKSVSWSEEANGKQLVKILEESKRSTK